MIERLLESLDKATCNFCAVKEIEERLKNAGYREFNPRDEWNLKPGDRFYCKKNSSSIFAFTVGKEMGAASGFRLIAAHSDSPGFKLKPNPELYAENGVTFLNVEKYGGGILYTWFDRPLSLSGRILVKTEDLSSVLNFLHNITLSLFPDSMLFQINYREMSFSYL